MWSKIIERKIQNLISDNQFKNTINLWRMNLKEKVGRENDLFTTPTPPTFSVYPSPVFTTPDYPIQIPASSCHS